MKTNNVAVKPHPKTRHLDIDDRIERGSAFSDDAWAQLAKLRQQISPPKPKWAGSEKQRNKRVGQLMSAQLKLEASYR
jgi:hypothetical protein